jgi:hypothetical protein
VSQGIVLLPLAFHGNGSPGHTGYQTSVNVNGAAHGSIPHTGVCSPLSKLDSQSKVVVVQTEREKMPRPVTLGLGPRGGGARSRSRRLGAEHVVLPATEATTPSFSVTDRASHRKRPTPRGPDRRTAGRFLVPRKARRVAGAGPRGDTWTRAGGGGGGRPRHPHPPMATSVHAVPPHHPRPILAVHVPRHWHYQRNKIK